LANQFTFKTMNKKEATRSRSSKIASFDPNGPARSDANVFGLPFSADESSVVLVPVPWEATVSYGGGTADGPQAIFDASAQVDLYHPEFPGLWKQGVHMLPVPSALRKQSSKVRKTAEKVIDLLSEGKTKAGKVPMPSMIKEVEAACESMIGHVQAETKKWLSQGKLVGLVGGDHSTPLGFIRALAENHSSFGVLQIDAHMDLRNAYEGFKYSHASIMYNVLQDKKISGLVQVGIRDYCEEEAEYVRKSKGRVKVFSYADVSHASYNGRSWARQCQEIIKALPSKVYVSFDIDGLDPKLCPNTGTPVPGGFEFHEITFLLSELVRSGRQVVGFDLNEVSPGKTDWDGNVGSRMLFHLCGVLAASNGLKVS
jgi:agmatinase